MGDRPEPGGDYPRNLTEVQDRYSTERDCRRLLDELRWGEDGEEFECPACGHEERWLTADQVSVCSSCERQTSPTAGTIFQKSKTPLRVWFQAAWLAAAQKHGISARGVQQALEISSYRTAWTLLRKLRLAMVRPGRDRLHGHVEVDEAWVGSRITPGNQPPKKTTGKGLVAIAVESMPHQATFGRIRMARIPNRKAATLLSFIKDSIKPGSVLHTDGHKGYTNLPQHFYFHQNYNQSKSSFSPTDLLPAVHRVASLLKRWKMGTHHGSMSRKHLDAYLDEFTFRFNRRRSRYRGLLFYRVLQYAVATEPRTYADLTT